MARFVQPTPPLPDLYAGDHVLRAYLDRLLGEVGHKNAKATLEALAADVAGPLHAAALDGEHHPPVLRQFDGWGRRIDVIEFAPGWDVLKRAAAQYGLVSLPYEDEARATYGAGARVLQMALLHLYVPWSSTYGCPVAMSDGAVTVLQADGVDPALRDQFLPRLLSRDGDEVWTSGQWMTESQGGSDVGRATTTAKQDADGRWRLTGEKWFCSSAASEFSIALARPEGAPDGSRGLACFVVPRYAGLVPDAGDAAPHHVAPGLTLHRLKDKLGTRGMASAEVGLDGALVWPVGDPAEPGLRRMLALVQITRLHNAASSAAGMRRGLVLARAYAGVREAFGAKLDQQPLHRETLSWLALDAEGAFALTAMCFDLLGRVEVDGDADAARQLRLAASLAKASTAKAAVASASEYIECFGGPGYIEDTEVPRMLRDSQVLPIWEGTTNVLSLDVVRALSRDDVLPAYSARVDQALSDGSAALGELAGPVGAVRDEIYRSAAAAVQDPIGAQAGARGLLLGMAHLLTLAALLEHAAYRVGDDRAALVAQLWARRKLLGDTATGEGHAHFDSLVDGA